MTVDVFSEAEARYEAASLRLSALYEEWFDEGSPSMSKGSMGQLVEHPLVKMIREHELLCDRLAAPLVKRHRGPAPSAVVAEDVGRSPAAKLRAVR